jgi:hypothetical protein
MMNTEENNVTDMGAGLPTQRMAVLISSYKEVVSYNNGKGGDKDSVKEAPIKILRKNANISKVQPGLPLEDSSFS